MPLRQYSTLDHWLVGFQHSLETVFGKPQLSGRPDPASAVPEGILNASEKQLAGRLMRVNHSGEVCAQALYQGQAMICNQSAVKEKLRQAAAEENDHLAWCEQRLEILDNHKSLINPLWYGGSLLIGIMAAGFGDRTSLGFLRETEQQVVAHLERHLQRLPKNDACSRQVLLQMQKDEAQHATTALEAGAEELPGIVKKGMALSAKVMTTITYFL